MWPLLVHLDAASPPREKMTQDKLPEHFAGVNCDLLVCEEVEMAILAFESIP